MELRRKKIKDVLSHTFLKHYHSKLNKIIKIKKYEFSSPELQFWPGDRYVSLQFYSILELLFLRLFLNEVDNVLVRMRRNKSTGLQVEIDS